MNKIKNILAISVLASFGLLQSCSLEEHNPGGFTLENLAANSPEGYESLINQCYFGMERYYYGSMNWMSLSEGDSDLWTNNGNLSTSYTEWFWFFAGTSPNTTFTNECWNGAYDGIGACNIAIADAQYASSFYTEAELNAKVAEARFMRAVYYYHLVEQFGGVVMITEPQNTANYAPERTDPLTIYREIIIPDLEYAVEWLPKGTDETTTTPTKKSALGFLAKACLQSRQYTDDFLARGLEVSRMLIADCEGGGSSYGAYMYPNVADVFAEENNFNNKEALWKHRWITGASGHGSSNGNYRTNRNNECFLCSLSRFGARTDNQESRTSWESGGPEGYFMPTQHLLALYQSDNDGNLDPRFHAWFNTQWNANQAYTWTEGDITNYGKSNSILGQEIGVGDLAIKFVMPQDEDYATEIANKAISNYVLIDYADVYDDANKRIKMTYNGVESQLRYLFPSLNKHNSGQYYVVNAGSRRNGNLNGTFMMRMPEIYLIAAELDIYLNGGANAMSYINKVRERAGAKLLTGTATIRTVLDERARELCGEYCRFYDLKRTGMFKDKTYLQETRPEVADYFKPEYALRPISTTYTAALSNGDTFQNPGY